MSNNRRLCGLIGFATKAGKIVAGTDACIKEIEKKRVNLVLVATDASERTKNKFKKITAKYGIAFYELFSIEEISKSIGKINKAVIGIKDVGFSNEIITIICGGE